MTDRDRIIACMTSHEHRTAEQVMRCVDFVGRGVIRLDPDRLHSLTHTLDALCYEGLLFKGVPPKGPNVYYPSLRIRTIKRGYLSCLSLAYSAIAADKAAVR